MIQLKELYVFMGPPGSGKGTLSQLCSTQLGWKQISTGNLCRKHIVDQTEIGKAIDFAIKSGKLISDDLITRMVMDWFEHECHTIVPVILDGYPRTQVQAEMFHTMLHKKFTHLQVTFVFFDINNDEVIKRLHFRSICCNKECQAVYSLLPQSHMKPKKEGLCDFCGSKLVSRSDDHLDSIKTRLEMYDYHAHMLETYYQSVGQHILRLNAQQSIDHVFKDFMHYIGRIVE